MANLDFEDPDFFCFSEKMESLNLWWEVYLYIHTVKPLYTLA